MIGEKIRILRERKKYTQEDLAEMLKVHNVTVSKWENGKMEPKMSKIKQIAKIFDVNTNYLLDDSEDQLLGMVHQVSNSDISPNTPFTAGIDKKAGTMTYSIGEQKITVPYNEKLFNKIFQAMLNNNSQQDNSNNSFSIIGSGNNGNQIIGNKEEG